MAYLFDPAVLHEIARRHLGLPLDKLFRSVIDDIARAYPGHVAARQEWVFNAAGGALGIMTVVHGSLSEYIAIYGTPIGTSGFSGRYHMDVYDYVLAGEMWTYTEKQFLERIVSRPGDLAVLPRGQAKGYKIPESCWMLEYARGIIPAALPFALTDALMFLEFRTILKTFWVYGKQAMKELWQGKI